MGAQRHAQRGLGGSRACPGDCRGGVRRGGLSLWRPGFPDGQGACSWGSIPVPWWAEESLVPCPPWPHSPGNSTHTWASPHQMWRQPGLWDGAARKTLVGGKRAPGGAGARCDRVHACVCAGERGPAVSVWSCVSDSWSRWEGEWGELTPAPSVCPQPCCPLSLAPWQPWAQCPHQRSHHPTVSTQPLSCPGPGVPLGRGCEKDSSKPQARVQGAVPCVGGWGAVPQRSQGRGGRWDAVTRQC